MKATCAADAKRLQDIPNIGSAMVKDFAVLGITKPIQLKGKDGYKLYEKLCEATATRHDPCVIDVFLAAIDFMNGAPPRQWWAYTEERKRKTKGKK